MEPLGYTHQDKPRPKLRARKRTAMIVFLAIAAICVLLALLIATVPQQVAH